MVGQASWISRLARGRLVALAAGLLMASAANAEDWPAWRGPRGDGISLEKSVPLSWSPEKNILWKTEIPGRGHSSPIVWKDRIFVTSAVESEEKRILLCLDAASGRTLWRQTVLVAPLESIHALNSYASSTPATDGEQVYVSFLDRDRVFLAAYDLEGNRRWEARPGPFASKHGYCANPVLYRDRLFINGDHDGDAFLAMLHKSDGSIAWKTPRENRTRSYCTPIVVRVDGRDQLMLNGSLCTAGYDCETGKQVWVCDGPSEQMVATLVHTRDMVFSLGGYPERRLLAIRKGGRGDVTDSHIVWRTHRSIPYVPSPLLYGDLLHVVSDEGIYTCFDPPTGKVHRTMRAIKHTSSSIVGAMNRVYVTDDRGTTLVLENAPSCRELARNSIGEDVFSTPAIAGGRIYLRGAKHLFCIGESAASASAGF